MDPTTLTPAWGVTGGGPFDINNLDGAGLYLGGHQVRTQPTYLFNEPVVNVDCSWMSNTDSQWVAHIWLPIDSQVVDVWDEDKEEWLPQWTISPMFFFLMYDAGTQTQTLRIENVDKWWGATVLDEFTGLPHQLIDLSVSFDTSSDTLTVTIDGELKGTYNYGVFNPPLGQGTDNAFAIGGGGNGEMALDYVRVEAVPEPATMLLLGGGLLGLMAARRKKK